MPEFDNELRGALFKNDKKGNEKAPDYKGTAQIKGQKFEVAAWVRTARSGQKYMSLSFEVPRQSQGSNAPAAAPAPTAAAVPTPTTPTEDIVF